MLKTIFIYVLQTLVFISSALVGQGLTWAQDRTPDGAGGLEVLSAEDLVQLSLEDILRLSISVATKTQESYLNTSGTVYVITQDDIRRFGWRDLGEILVYALPNIAFSYDGMKYFIGVRGYEPSPRTIILLDGRPTEQYMLLGDAFSSNNIERVEILMGPNAALYGGYALEAIINVVTRTSDSHVEPVVEVETLIGDGDTQEISAIARMSSEEADIGFHFTTINTSQNWDRWQDYYSSTRFLRSPSPPTYAPESWQQRKEDRAWDFYLRYKNWLAGGSYQRLDTTPDNLEASWRYTTTPYGRRDIWELYNYYAGYKNELSTKLSLSAEAGLTYVTRDKTRGVWSAGAQAEMMGDVGEGRVDHTYRWIPSLRTQLTATPDLSVLGEKHRFVVGSEPRWENSRAAPRAFGVDGGELGVDPEKSQSLLSVGLFIGDEIWIKPDRIRLSVGASANVVSYGSGHQESSNQSYSKFLPRLSALWVPVERAALKYTMATGYRPTWSGVTKIDPEAEALAMHELNYSHSAHLGELQLLNIMAASYLQYQDMLRLVIIPQRGPANAWTVVEVPSLWTASIEDMLRFQYRQLSGYLAVSGMIRQKEGGDFLNSGGEQLLVPNYMVRAGLSYRWFSRLTTSAVLLGSGAATTFATGNSGEPEKRTIPAWLTVDLNLQWDAIHVTPMFDFGLAFRVGNVFDRGAWSHYPDPDVTMTMYRPRTFRVSLVGRYR